MNDLLGLAVILLVLLAGVYGLNVISKPRAISEEEFERRAHENPGLLNAGVMGLQKALEPGAARAIETREALRRGRYDRKQTTGEGVEDDGESDA